MVDQLIQKKQEEKQIQEDQAANTRYWKIPGYYDDDDEEEESNSLKDNNISELPSCSAVTPNETVDSLIMGDKHLDTIPATKSDEFINSSVENLVPNPSESEGENSGDLPACFTTFSNILFDDEYEFDSADDQSLHNEDFPKEIFSNPLFEEEINSIKKNQHHFNAESELIGSLLNYDSSIIPSSSKIDSLLDEFAGELTLLKSIPPELMKLIIILRTKFVFPRDCCMTIHLLVHRKNLFLKILMLMMNLSLHILLWKKIDLTFTPDDPMPPSIEEDDDDSRDTLIREELLDNYSLPIPENKLFHFDIPLSSRPPVKPPDGNKGILNIKMMGDVYDQKVPIPELTITLVSNHLI
uniref:Reverse transcriptase domain-containing protein n=1 Tax=Tanacetum cinerariifolium TaxID=118510 RepID=A0A699KWE8_TANCI|nr:hypothetical protein [Tanacetum cinerariifolium]